MRADNKPEFVAAGLNGELFPVEVRFVDCTNTMPWSVTPEAREYPNGAWKSLYDFPDTIVRQVLDATCFRSTP